MSSFLFAPFERFNWSTEVKSLPEFMSGHAAAIIHGVPIDDNKEFIRLAKVFGNLSLEGINTTTNRLEDGLVHLVTRLEEPAKDPFGNSITSTTNLDFDLHTDEYFSANPARFVFLLCFKQSARGGESLVTFLDMVLPLLEPTIIRRLRDASYPSQVGTVPVLSEAASGFTIRFNELELKRAELGGYAPPCPPRHQEAIDQLLKTARQRAVRFKLFPGDCLIVDNLRTLHGRAGFDEADVRLLKRLRAK